MYMYQQLEEQVVADTTDASGGNFLSLVHIQSHAQTEILEMEGLLLLMSVIVVVARIGRRHGTAWRPF